MDSFYEYLCCAYAFCYSILAAVIFRLPMGICARFSLSQCIYMYVTSAVGLGVIGFYGQTDVVDLLHRQVKL